jgi:hypothetical protein
MDEHQDLRGAHSKLGLSVGGSHRPFFGQYSVVSQFSSKSTIRREGFIGCKSRPNYGVSNTEVHELCHGDWRT